MTSMLSPKIFQIVLLVSGIWLLLWLANKIGGTMLLVAVLGTFAVGMIWDALNEQMERIAKRQLAIANANCGIAALNARTSQNQLAASIERTKQLKWGLLSGVIGLIGVLVKIAPHWFGH